MKKTLKDKHINIEVVKNVLSDTIKGDDPTKLITFLAMLSTYTDDSQLNVALIGPSSSGKSFIVQQVSKLFPDEDVKEYGYVTPTAFFYGYKEEDLGGGEKKRVVDLEKKILVFLDSPGTELLAKMRPFFSKDSKEIVVKSTDKNKSGSNKAKEITLRGFSSTFYCSANQKMDVQESSRFIILSPEVTQEKLYESIKATAASLAGAGREQLFPLQRGILKTHIEDIKQLSIKDIFLSQSLLESKFLAAMGDFLKARNQRDIAHVAGLVKAHALLMYRERHIEKGVLYASEEDFEVAFDLWHQIAEAQQLGVNPHSLTIYLQAVRPAYIEKNKDAYEGEYKGLREEEIIGACEKVGIDSDPTKLRQSVLKSLSGAGVIERVKDPDDGRYNLVHVTSLKNNIQADQDQQEGTEEPSLEEVIDSPEVQDALRE